MVTETTSGKGKQMSDTPPFIPTVGESFIPSTEVGVVQSGTLSGGNYTVTSIENAFNYEIKDSPLVGGTTPLAATGITVTGVSSGVNYTTQGQQDYTGTNLNGVGGVTISNTTEFDTSFATSNPVLAQFGISTVTGQTYYIGTDGTHAFVESVILIPGVAGGFVGHGGTIIVDAELAQNPFITGTGVVAVNNVFDTQGAPIPCYLRGTMIATPDGERAVEDLAIGDLVSTASGEARAIRWIGSRAYASRFASKNSDVQPIVFEAGSIAENMPVRALRVSPDHAMFVDGVLVPAAALVNGTSIRRAEGVETIEYFHVELDSHDILIADGAHAESFVDCDSRSMFHNAAEHAALYPEDNSAQWTFCAPRLEDGARVEAIRARLAARARTMLDTIAA